MNVLVLVPFCEEHMARIRDAATPATVVQQVFRRRSPKDEKLHEALRHADVVIGEPPVELLLADDVNVKWVQMTWAGTDMYTASPLAFPSTTMLTNVAGKAYGHVISQYVVGQILAITQNLARYRDQQRQSIWRDLGPNVSLEGATVLVYGAGDIGQHVAKRLQGFDCERIIGVCRDTSSARPWFDELVTLSDADAVLPDANVVVNCLPHAPQTQGYFDETRLRRMRPGAVLVNVGRGSFVDLDALNIVLEEGRLLGAALDVTNPEPLPPAHALWANPRCIITPHISGGAFGHSVGTEERICQITCDNLCRYLAGNALAHRVL